MPERKHCKNHCFGPTYAENCENIMKPMRTCNWKRQMKQMNRTKQMKQLNAEGAPAMPGTSDLAREFGRHPRTQHLNISLFFCSRNWRCAPISERTKKEAKGNKKQTKTRETSKQTKTIHTGKKHVSARPGPPNLSTMRCQVCPTESKRPAKL